MQDTEGGDPAFCSDDSVPTEGGSRRINLSLPAEISVCLWQGQRSHRILQEICHSVILWRHVEERDSSAVIDGTVAEK